MADHKLESFESHLRVEADLGDGFVRLRSAEAQRRQAVQDIRSTEDIVIEMLRNARDAHATHIFLALSRDDKKRRLVMLDNGDGIPPAVHERVFDPRVTSKLDTAHIDKWGVHGRGMALYSIAVNAEVAQIVTSEPGRGSSFLVETNLENLREKTDQSSFPTFEYSGNDEVIVRGPRNILRTACEFALEARHDCAAYVGSVTDVAATLYAYGLSSLTSSKRAFTQNFSDLGVCMRLSATGDPTTFAKVSSSIGLPLSERSARRILDGNIDPIAPLLSRIHIEGLPDQKSNNVNDPVTGSTKPLTDARGLRISPDDLAAFTDEISTAFASLARDYYLEQQVTPTIRLSKEALHITIPLEKIQ